MQQYRLSSDWSQSTFVENDLMSCLVTNWAWIRIMPLWQRRQLHIGQECSQQVEKNHCLCLLCTCQIAAGVLCPVSVLPIEERHWYICMSSAVGCHDSQWLKDMTQRKRLEEYYLLSLKRKLKGKPIAVHNYLIGGTEKLEPGSS